MRMELLKVVVVLLVAGSGDSRPQKSGRCLIDKLHANDISRGEMRREGNDRSRACNYSITLIILCHKGRPIV